MQFWVSALAFRPFCSACKGAGSVCSVVLAQDFQLVLAPLQHPLLQLLVVGLALAAVVAAAAVTAAAVAVGVAMVAEATCCLLALPNC